MFIHNWQQNKYIINWDLQFELNAYLNLCRYYMETYGSLTEPITSVFIKPASGTGSLSTDEITNAALILRDIRSQVNRVGNLNYKTDFINQPQHYDACLSLQEKIFNLENSLETIFISECANLINGLNMFYLNFSGLSYNQYWYQQGEIPHRGNEFIFFRQMWREIRREELFTDVYGMTQNLTGLWIGNLGDEIFLPCSMELHIYSDNPIEITSITYINSSGTEEIKNYGSGVLTNGTNAEYITVLENGTRFLGITNIQVNPIIATYNSENAIFVFCKHNI